MSHKAHHTMSKHVATCIPLYTTFAIRQFEGLCPSWPFFPHPPPMQQGGISGTPHPITCCVGTLTHHLVLPWAESPGWFLRAQAAQRGQYLLLLPKIVVFKRAGRNVKMFLITNTTFGAPVSRLIEPVERDPRISGDLD